jgi:hypothetical protein
MKKFFAFITFIAMTSSFANTISVYKFDDVDAVAIHGKTVSVEDLRDGFVRINGIQVNSETVSVANESKVLILLRNPTPNKSFGISTMATKIGGDGGGG